MVTLLIGLVFFWANSSWGCDYLSKQYSDGVKAWNSEKYDVYVEKMTPCAEGGDVLIQSQVCSTYLYRLRPPKFKEGLHWCSKAAESGSLAAQVHLSNIYFMGWGVPQDWEYAYLWSNIAAASGDENARGHLSTIQKVMTKEAILNAQRLTRECIVKQYKGC